jgi:hypothetical protein
MRGKRAVYGRVGFSLKQAADRNQNIVRNEKNTALHFFFTGRAGARVAAPINSSRSWLTARPRSHSYLPVLIKSK